METVSTTPFGVGQTPRSVFLYTQRAIMVKYMQGWAWRPDGVVNGENVSLLPWMSSAPWSSSYAYDTRRHVSPQLTFSVAIEGKMFWHLLPGPVIGGQVCGVL